MFIKVFLMALAMFCLLPTNLAEKYKPEQYHAPIPYSFSYGIKDDYNGAHYGQDEKSNGKEVRGEYTVQLPDGRLQKVNYMANHDIGYIADVSYEGVAKYPSKGAPPKKFTPQKKHE